MTRQGSAAGGCGARGVADAPSMAELLLRHGVPVTLLAVSTVVPLLNEKVLELLLTAGRPSVPLGREEGPENWRGTGMKCPLYNLLTCQLAGPGARARRAELLAAGDRTAGHLPPTCFQLVAEGRLGQQDEEVVVHLHDLCPVEDLVAAQPALRARLRDADRCVPITMAAVN